MSPTIAECLEPPANVNRMQPPPTMKGPQVPASESEALDEAGRGERARNSSPCASRRISRLGPH